MSTLHNYLYSDYSHLDAEVKVPKVKPVSVNPPSAADIAYASAKRYISRGESMKAVTVLEDHLDSGDARILDLYDSLMKVEC